MNEEINELGWYKVFDTYIIFYGEGRYGYDKGWLNIQSSRDLGFEEVEAIFRNQLEDSLNCVYRYGTILNFDNIKELIYDYGELKGIETPDLMGDFGIYKLNSNTNELELISSDPGYDLKGVDGIYYVTEPGLIPHRRVNMHCKEK